MITKQYSKDRDALRYIDNLLKETEFAEGEIRTPAYKYIYLIEGWESECIAEDITKKNGDWEDNDYIYELIENKHDQIFVEEFADKYDNFEVIRNEIIDGCQFGISVIVIRVPLGSKNTCRAHREESLLAKGYIGE